jgi:23S rRNA A2030 N6-methylase RlmJ
MKKLVSMATSELGCLYQENHPTMTADAKVWSQLEKIVQVLKTRPLSEREEVYHSMKAEARAVGKQTSGIARLLSTRPLVRLCRAYIDDVLQPNPTDESQDKK